MGARQLLRDGWRWVRFDEMAESVTDRVDDPSEAGVEHYVGLEHLDSDSLEIRRWGSPGEVNATKLRFEPGDIIFGRRRAYQRKVAVAAFEGICSAHALVLRANEEVVDKDFLAFFMQSDVFFDRALSISVGSLSPTINWRTLARQEFALPPRSEQSKIASVLLAADTAGRELRGVQRAAQVLLAAAVEQFFPLKWQASETIRLEQLTDLQVGFPFPSNDFVPAGTRLLRCSNVGIGRANWEAGSTRFWPRARIQEFQQFLLTAEDLVIAMDGTFTEAGFKIARLTCRDVPSLLLQRVGRFLLKQEEDRDYVWAYIHSRRFKAHLMRERKATTIAHISRSDILSAPLERHSPSERSKIGNVFRAIEQNNQRVERQLVIHSNLRTQLLQQLLLANP